MSPTCQLLMPDVKDFEPSIALDGGPDGLVFYRRIAEKGYNIIKKGGLIAFEIGYNQSADVEQILKDNGFSCVETLKDLAGNDRVVSGIKE